MMLAALALGAGSIALPRYEPGDAFVFSDGRVEQVVAVAGERVTWSGLSGSDYVRSRNFLVPVLAWRSRRGEGQRSFTGAPDSLWAAAGPGSERFRVIARTRLQVDAGWRRAVTLWTCRRQRPRSVTLSFAEVDTVPFACDRYSATSMRLLERLEWDYAPEIGHYVRRSAIDYFRGTRRTITLVATLSGPAANRRRLAALSRAARRGEDLWTSASAAEASLD